jgi:cyclopropane-fatty-acyl-phospholipid synthase
METTLTEATPPFDPRALGDRFAARASGLARRLVLRRLRGLARGSVTLVESDACERFGRRAPDLPLEASVRVRDPRFWAYVCLRGTVGAGESYMLGHWECDDLPALVRVLVANAAAWEGVERGSRLAGWLLRAQHWRRRNTRRGAARNVGAHYDLGNDFFELFLDPTLTYSSAWFADPGLPLADAQRAKYDRICRKLALRPGDEVLEIGTGWGGFALHAAARYGARVTSTTISREQYEVARERVRSAGLSQRVTLLLEDYRDLRGRYDHLVSIEMIEAVGADHFDTYFRVCSERLREHGMALVQAILTPDHTYEASLRSVDFMKRYIFPGGQLPSVGAICRAIVGTDLRFVDLDDMGSHYALTLRRWRERFLRNRERIRALRYSESFLRMWEYYLALCEGGFAERVISVAQVALAKPRCARPVLRERELLGSIA